TSALVEGVVLKTTFNTKGRGFSGVVKRWNFAGGRASHGHRMGKRTGSIGNAEWPGRVQPGKKMPGQYGNVTNSVKNDVVSFDAATGILVVKGSVSGANGALGKVKVS
ncbi:MAG: 50S ribosomal protein L3, partial [Campylobacteraceae bacterium]|nr:50S ribosomal protein L3 [Campylobacteraceae bacterium]